MARTTSTSRIKVSASKLLEAVRARREKMVADHERALKAHGPKEAAYRRKVVKALHDTAVKVEEGGDFPDTAYNGRLNIPCRAQRPGKPTLSLSGIDRLISTLEIATDDSIVMSADDAALYLG